MIQQTKQQLITSKIVIPSLVICVGQACTLKCKDCGNFTPYAPKHMLRYSMQKIINDLNLLIENATITHLGLQGGEAFLHPELNSLLQFIVNTPDIKQCQIATNGTLLPNVDVKLLQHDKMSIRISNYTRIKSIKTELIDYKAT